MEVLLCLAKNYGEVVERDKIAADVWAGRFVSDDPISGRIAEIRQALGDSAQSPKHIETVPKRGYRLISRPEELDISTVPSQRTKTYGIALLGVLALASVVMFAIPGLLKPGQPILQGPATVALVPFRVMSEDVQTSRFAEGLSEIVYHRLSQTTGLVVSARSSSFSYRGQPIDPISFGETLGTRALVTGSLQSAPGGYRLTVELVATESGETLWSDIIDAPLEDRFATQDRISEAIVTNVRKHILPANTSSTDLMANANLEAYELYLLGRSQSASPNAPDAVDLFRAAIAKDVKFAPAYAGLADALWQAARNRDPDFPFEATMAEAREAANQAVQFGPEYADGYASQILFARSETDISAAETWYQKAVAANPGHVAAYVRFADVLQRSGTLILDPSRLDRSAALLNRALALDPLNARLKQRRALLGHLRGNADALEQAKADYGNSRSSSEAIIALETMANIAADLGSLDQAIAYLMIAAQLSGESTGLISLEIAAHYLQMGEFDQANLWLQKVPRPLGYYGALQLATFYLETGQIQELDDLIAGIIAGSHEEVALPADAGALMGIYFSESPLNCKRAIELSSVVSLPEIRLQGLAFPDMLLSMCHELDGDEELAALHRMHALDIGERIDAVGINDAFTFYEKATVRAFAHDADEAIRYLQHAYDRGACFSRVIERSVFLKQLSHDFRYVQLLSDFRANNDRMRQTTFLARQSGNWYDVVGIEAKFR